MVDVTGINFHWGSYYSAFYATWTMPNVVMPRGLFYAMWFFVQTIRNSSVILTPSVDSTSMQWRGGEGRGGKGRGERKRRDGKEGRKDVLSDVNLVHQVITSHRTWY